ncbi:hypothetical protein EWM62_11660 [Mucilaginibacter terrigena]|uniref:Uncharacterized protein n=1 Tax=Mucilaginibacter terrigena TaxID=2492395 RepID=A0A4Q5LKR2_9SPHI|nr:hypothetical protein [Mucilaginibacter terrigena]RYU90188.1 hypothetical protein EWM62_11660 [Mucilaginibacter terrigena]
MIKAASAIKKACTRHQLTLDKINFDFNNFSTLPKGDNFKLTNCWKFTGISEQAFIVSYSNSYRLAIVKPEIDYRPYHVTSDYLAAYIIFKDDTPDTIIQPITFAEMVMNILFHQNIKIPMHSGFNKKYLLQSGDKNRIVEILIAGVIEIFELQDDLHLEIRNNECLIYLLRPIQENDGLTLANITKKLLNR